MNNKHVIWYLFYENNHIFKDEILTEQDCIILHFLQIILMSCLIKENWIYVQMASIQSIAIYSFD
jgi:hypothetical protein